MPRGLLDTNFSALSQFVNPADRLQKSLTGPGGLLSEQIARMTADEQQQQKVLSDLGDKAFRSERAVIADGQWGQELSLKEKALAIQAAEAKARRDDRSEANLSKQMLVENLTKLEQYKDNPTQVLDTEQVGKVFAPWDAKPVISPEEQTAYLNKEAGLKAIEELGTINPSYADPKAQIKQDTASFIKAETGQGPIMAGIKNWYNNRPPLFEQKSEAEKQQEAILAPAVVPEAQPSFDKLKAEHLGYLSGQQVERNTPDVSTMALKDIEQTFGKGVSDTVSKTINTPTMKSADEYVAPLLKTYNTMEAGPKKNAMAATIASLYSTAQTTTTKAIDKAQTRIEKREDNAWLQTMKTKDKLLVEQYKAAKEGGNGLKQQKLMLEVINLKKKGDLTDKQMENIDSLIYER